VRPAHQRLEAGDASGRKVDQRLIIRPQHVVLDRVAQIDLDLAAALGASVHSGFEKAEGAAGIVLGSGQRHVGVLQQLLGLVAIARRHRDADAGAGHDGMAVKQKGIADRFEQPPAQQHRVFRPSQPALDDREFIGVETGKRILLAQRRSKALGDGAQQLVAGAVAERIVDRLEIIETEHQHRDLVCAAPGVLQNLVHALTQQIAVRQPGQGVVLRHEGEPRVGAFALGNIHQRQQYRGPVAIEQMTRIDRQIDQRSVGPHMLPGTGRLFVA